MADITADNKFIFGDADVSTTPQVITRSWNDRLAGTAFIGADAMTGVVIAIALDGPTIAGVSTIEADGSWEITNIAERFATTELLVIGIPSDSTTNLATASRVKPV